MRAKVKAEAGAAQVHGTRGLAVGSLFHFMQTLTHALKELKNTLNHTGSVPHLPPDIERYLAEWGWGLRVQMPPILGQGGSVGPGSSGGSVLSPQRKSAETGPRPQAGRPHSHSDWQGGPGRVLPGPSPEGPPRCGPKIWGGAGTKMPLGLAARGGQQCPWVLGAWRSVLAFIRTPLESVVLMCVGKDLVSHPPEQAGRGFRG